MATPASSRVSTLPVSLVLLLVCALLPIGLNDEYLYVASVALIYATVAVGLDLFAGYGGVLSLCNFAFVAVGAYVSAVLVTDYVWSPWASLAGSIGAAALAALIIGSLIVRLRHLGAALATFSFGFVVYIFLEGNLLAEWTRSSSGLPAPVVVVGGSSLSEGLGLYYLAFVILAVTVFMTSRYVGSRAGKALRVVKRSDTVAESLGINSYVSRLSAFVFSAAIAGAAGFAYGQALVYISPGSFGTAESVHLLAMVVVGGLGTVAGPILGALSLEFVGHAADIASGARELLFAGVLLGALVMLPGGLYALIERGLTRVGFFRLSSKVLRPTLAITLESKKALRWSDDPHAGVGTDHESGGPREGVSPELQLEGVAVRFGGVEALRDVNMTLKGGEIRALIGPNGAGKTTLLNCISGLQSHAGSIRLGEGVLSGSGARSVRRSGVTRTFQHPSLVPDLTVLENVELGLFGASPRLPIWDVLPTPAARRRQTASRRAALEALALIGFPSERWNIPASSLTLAEQKLVDVARAIAGKPRLLLMDEPTAGLEHDEMESLAEVIRRIRVTTGATIVIIAHHVGFVRSLADEVTVLDFGAVLASGSSDEVIARKDVATVFLGESHV